MPSPACVRRKRSPARTPLKVEKGSCAEPSSCPARNLPLFHHAVEKTLRRFRQLATLHAYHRENILFYQGNRPQGLYFICSGRVKITKEDSGGRSQIVRIVNAPDLLGDRAFFAEKPYACTGTTMEESRICFLETRHFWDTFGQDHEMLRLLIQSFAQKLGGAEERMHCLAACMVKSRIAGYLLATCRKLSNASAGKSEFVLQETRTELAQIIGTTPEVISRSLAELCSTGWIAVQDRRVRIKDEKHLREVSCPHNLLA
ncbi:MAG: Crp/Fnr family transcriptional regulator [Elusimicrobia bacterium]|nr:Crp/Fnr family transcriptional regulator [Elusimicrobiota bacterium]